MVLLFRLFVAVIFLRLSTPKCGTLILAAPSSVDHWLRQGQSYPDSHPTWDLELKSLRKRVGGDKSDRPAKRPGSPVDRIGNEPNKRPRPDEEIDLDVLYELGQKGEEILEEEEKVANSPPALDPQLDLPMFTTENNIVQPKTDHINIESMGFLLLLKRSYIIASYGTYAYIQKELPDDKFGAHGEISITNHHMAITLDEYYPSDIVQLTDWIYNYWSIAFLHSSSSGGELRYITIDNIRDLETIRILSAVLDQWQELEFGNDLGSDFQGVVLNREDINEKLARNHAHEQHTLKYIMWSILYTIRPVSSIVRMLHIYPNAFYHRRPSTIAFQLVRKDGIFVFANIFIELEQKPLDKIMAPIAQRVPLSNIRNTLFPNQLYIHAAAPDITRTSYTPLRFSADNLPTTFLRHDVRSGQISYRFSTSIPEKQCVFERFIDSADQPLPQALGSEADRNLGHVLFSVWIENAGMARLDSITFGYVDPESVAVLDVIRGLRKLSDEQKRELGFTRGDDEAIAIVDSLDDDFASIFDKIKALREGKVITTLIKNYGPNLGISAVASLEIGKYLDASDARKRGDLFMLVGFKHPRDGIAETSSSPRPLPIGELSMLELDSPMSPASLSDSIDLDLQTGPQYTPAENLVALCLRTLANGAALYASRKLDGMGLNRAQRPGLEPLLTIFHSSDVEKETIAEAHPDEHLYDALNDGDPAWNEFPVLVREDLPDRASNPNNIYDGISIGMAYDSERDNSFRYCIAMHYKFGHLVVLRNPVEQRIGMAPLEDIMFAAWHRKYQARGPIQDEPRIYSGKPLLVSFLSVCEGTRKILAEVFVQKKLSTTETLYMKDATRIESTSKKTEITSHENQRIWTMLVGCPEIAGAHNMFLKYRETRYYPRDPLSDPETRYQITAIMVKWVRKAGGEESPEVFIIGARYQDRHKTMMYLSPTLPDKIFREHFSLGSRLDTVLLLQQHLKKLPDLDSSSVLQINGHSGEETTSRRLSKKEMLVFNGLRTHMLRRKGESFKKLTHVMGRMLYRKCNIYKADPAAEDIAQEVMVSINGHYLILENELRPLESTVEQATELSPIIYHAHTVQSLPERVGFQDGLKLVAFRKVSKRTEDLFWNLWRQFRNPRLKLEERPLQLQVTVAWASALAENRKCDNMWGNKVTSQWITTSGWIVVPAIYGTAEVAGVMKCLENYPLRMKGRIIDRVYFDIDDSEGGTGMKLIVLLSDLATGPEDEA
ncbi:hypothetical protein H072_3927 [Dactylellina haptotyla CBS 200.50]|uniref:Uncharacterized protein n=1 Tax=Dactylellina haptotyla (strain CBS 200.50) TaxID=1284197 RepID=S8AGL8_DACHA|nr:hypothetical protein H072_3927 [Dactylellina haptotyla CBS 200.50]